MKKALSAITLVAALALLSGTASAHVSVYPKESTAGSYEKYTVRVPVEKDINTTKVRIEFPQGVKVGTVMPIAGWTYEWEQDADGRNTALTWTATAGGIKAHEFTEFAFSGKNPDDASELAWKAYQTYADGTVVEWTGDKESKTPASVTALKPKAAGDDHHGGGDTTKETAEEPKKEETTHATETQTQTAAAPEATATSGNTLPLVLSGLAVLLAAVSFFRKKA